MVKIVAQSLSTVVVLLPYAISFTLLLQKYTYTYYGNVQVKDRLSDDRHLSYDSRGQWHVLVK